MHLKFEASFESPPMYLANCGYLRKSKLVSDTEVEREALNAKSRLTGTKDE